MKKVLCAGEALFDFISLERKKVGFSSIFEKRVGGAPLNVAVGLARLGFDVTYLVKLSNDSFGKAIYEFLASENIDVRFVKFDPNAKTTLAFVSVDEKGIPEFEFYRDNAADTLLNSDDLKGIKPEDFELFHFGSIAMCSHPTADTLWNLFQSFKGKTLTSFDPNIRPNLVKDRRKYLEILKAIFKDADIVKMSLEDLEWLGWERLEDFVSHFKRSDKITVLTKGEAGSEAIFRGKKYHQKAFTVERVIDTTGCGDTFMAGFIAELLKNGLRSEAIQSALEFGSASAALVAMKKGAAPSMPTLNEVNMFLRKTKGDLA